MATVTGYSLPIDMLYAYPNDGFFFYADSNYLDYAVDGTFIEFSGTGFTYHPFTGDPTGGTMTRIDIFDSDFNPVATITGFSVPLTTFYYTYFLDDNWLGFLSLVASGADSIVGSSADDTLFGFEGNDTIRGEAGNDVLFGGDGSDLVDGGPGNDFLFGDVTLVEGVGFGNDTLLGGDGSDVLEGEEGDDSLVGDAGHDFLFGGVGNDTLIGGEGEDALDGEEGDDSLLGGNGIDFFIDRQGSNTISGGADDDFIGVFVPVGGTSFATGGTGQDIYFSLGEEEDLFSGWGTFIVTDFASGGNGDYLLLLDLIFTSLDYGFFGSNPLDPSQGFLQLAQDGPDTVLKWDVDGAAGAFFTLREVIRLANINAATLTSDNFFGLFLTGGDGNDSLVGGPQYDLISALAGDDTLDGASGIDTLQGGSGSDLYYVDDPKDVVVETSNEPPPLILAISADESGAPAPAALEGFTDTIVASVNYSLANVAFVENLTLATGSGAVTGTGNELNNVLTGNALNNTLSGAGGRDTLNGGAGNDTLEGGASADMAVFSGNRASYAITGTAPNFTVSGADGSDTLASIERLQFSDKKLAFDLGANEAAGNTVRIIGAAFDAPAIQLYPQYVRTGLNLFDNGMSMSDACALVMGTGLVQALAGSSSNEAFVNLVFQNVVGFAPSDAQRATFVGMLQGSGGSMSQAELLQLAANHPLNALNINLVGLQDSGVEFA